MKIKTVTKGKQIENPLEDAKRLQRTINKSTTTTRGGGLRMPPKRGHDTHRLLQTILELKKYFTFF